jgi:aminoglycoside phosphotransferase family enzyme/predicted kinase
VAACRWTAKFVCRRGLLWSDRADDGGLAALAYRIEMQTGASSPLTVDPTLVAGLREHLRAQTGRDVSLIETHISWVLLTDRLAYKLKKPIRLPFVDFTSLAARKHYCEEELRLNARLAASIYLDVVPVCGARESPHLGGCEAIDYAVRMQRFPEDALLRNLVLHGRLRTEHLERFAQRLSAFHGEARVAPMPSEFGAPQQVLRAMNLALAGLADDHGAPRLEALRAWVTEHGALLRTAWIERQRRGAVRECHGDLHLSNVVLIDKELTAFDCIEFDASLRWIDVMSDVAFLTMDLKAHGRADLAFRFLDVYLQHSGDYAGVTVLRAYEVYRALVRAMVADLCARATAAAGAARAGPDYLACAEALASRSVDAPPRLMITHGLSGSGKSTVATGLMALAGAIRIRSDVERKRLFGLAALQRSAAQNLDIYTPEATRRTFDRLWNCARTTLQAGYPVIVDAAFLRRDERSAFRALATELRVPFSILHCHAAESLLRQRVALRETAGADASEANLIVLEHQLTLQEPLDDAERLAALEVDTEVPPDMTSLLERWLAQSR